jgi:hypothetical protein
MSNDNRMYRTLYEYGLCCNDVSEIRSTADVLERGGWAYSAQDLRNRADMLEYAIQSEELPWTKN